MGEKKSGKGLIIIIIVLAGILLVGGGGGAYYFLVLNKAKEVVNPLKDEITFSLGEFTNRLSDVEPKYIKTTIYVGYKNNAKLTKEITDKKAILRDTVNTVLRSKKISDFSVRGTDQIKTEIKTALNPLLENGQLTNVYYDSIMVQE